MTDTDTIQREADRIRTELQRHASEAGYQDVQQYLAENENAAEVQQLAQQAQQLQQQAVHATVKTEREKLLENAPGLRNEKTRQAFAKWLQEERGYTKEQIAGTLDHRVMTDLYRSYRSAAPKKTIPKVTKPNGEDKPDTDKQSNGADASADNGNAEDADNDLRSPAARIADDLYPDLKPALQHSGETPSSDQVEILYPTEGA